MKEISHARKDMFERIYFVIAGYFLKITGLKKISLLISHDQWQNNWPLTLCSWTVTFYKSFKYLGFRTYIYMFAGYHLLCLNYRSYSSVSEYLYITEFNFNPM